MDPPPSQIPSPAKSIFFQQLPPPNTFARNLTKDYMLMLLLMVASPAFLVSLRPGTLDRLGGLQAVPAVTEDPAFRLDTHILRERILNFCQAGSH